jgi:hypothetical protein
LLKAQALQQKITDATAEYNALAQELSDETPAPTKLGELKKAIAGLKRAKREAAKEAKKQLALSQHSDHNDLADQIAHFSAAKPAVVEEKKDEIQPEKDEIQPELTVEAVETLQKSIAEEESDEEDEEDEITLDESTPKVEIDGTEYYKTKAYGLPAVLFDMEGECIGAYDESTGEIQELAFEE